MLVTAAIIFLVSIDVSRRLMSRAVAALSLEQKAMVAEPRIAMSKRGWLFIPVGVLLGILGMFHGWIMAGILIVAFGLTIRGVVLRFRRLSALRLPAAYVRRVRFSVAVLAFGVTLMVGAALYGTLTFLPR